MANMYGYNTSTARKLNVDSREYGHNLQNGLHKESKSKVRSGASRARGLKVSTVALVALVFAAAFVIVNGYVAINEAKSEILELKEEYNDMIAENQAIQVKIDKAVDLSSLQTVAEEKFGMMRPERYQMFYVDLSQNDFSESTERSKDADGERAVAVTGVTGTITGTLNIFN